MAFSQVTVTGPLPVPSTAVLTGATVTFTLSQAITNSGSTIPATPVQIRLNANSSTLFSYTFNANNDGATTPANTYYTVTVQAGDGAVYILPNAIVPAAQAGNTIPFSSLTTYTIPSTSTVVTDSFGYVPSSQLLLASNFLRPNGYVAETYPRSLGGSGGFAPTSGTLYLDAIVLEQNTTIGHIGYSFVAAATSPTNWWYGLYDVNLNQLAVTANQLTAAIGANSFVPLAIATTAAGSVSSFTTTYTGIHYVGIMEAAGTPATINDAPASTSAHLALAPKLSVTTTSTGLTNPPAFPFQAVSSTTPANVRYAVVGP